MDNLVFQIQQDSEYAFKQLYQIYYAKVVSFITGIIKAVSYTHLTLPTSDLV